jgi:uncharacterized protein YrrD
MLSKIKTLHGYKLESKDGEIGKIKDFYFDDRHWTIRYLVAETGTWLASRQVLISPYALIDIDKEAQTIAVKLTKEQIEGSPSLDTDKPVSRQWEQDYYGYFSWPAYWNGPYSWGAYPDIDRNRNEAGDFAAGTKPSDHHLRSTHAVSGYSVQALDGDLGHVEDFILDDQTWAIRYLVVNTSNWWQGKQVLVAPPWIGQVSWSDSKVVINLSRQTIKESPAYTNESRLTRDYEIGLHGHYNRKGYWVAEVVSHAGPV